MNSIACALAGCLCFGVFAAPQHGNNPTIDQHTNQESTWDWYGVSFAGSELIAVPAGVYWMFDALIPGTMTEAGTGLDCGELALLICQDAVCCVCTEPCSFSCQDSQGNCQPCPHCGESEPDFGIN